MNIYIYIYIYLILKGLVNARQGTPALAMQPPVVLKSKQ